MLPEFQHILVLIGRFDAAYHFESHGEQAEHKQVFAR